MRAVTTEQDSMDQNLEMSITEQRFAAWLPRGLMLVFLVCLLLPLRKFTPDLAKFNQTVRQSSFLTDAFAGLRYRLGDRVFDSTIVPNPDWIVLTGYYSMDNYQRTQLFTGEELQTINRQLDEVQAFLEGQGASVLLVFPPDKNSIYPERVPAEIQVIGAQSRLDQFLAYIQAGHSLPVLDLRPALQQARQERQVYYACDSHWNPYGAYAAYREILVALQPEHPALRSHALQEYQYSSLGLQSGDLSQRLARLNLREERFTLQPHFPHNVTEISLPEPPGQVKSILLNPAGSVPRMLVYNDSLIWELQPFLSDHFQEIWYMHEYSINRELLKNFHPDVVIIEITERYLYRLLDVKLE